MPSYTSVEPTVIDEELLQKAVQEAEAAENQKRPTGADVPTEMLSRGQNMDPGQVHTLTLDYKNILKIDNLAAYENLVKLQLDNNVIEKMENLHFLVNLQWLDLSFNNITKIEGLQGLHKLTDLSLYNNRIQTLENMDDLHSLQLFSIGNNAVHQLENVAYLSRFSGLRVVNMAGNPVSKHADYKSFTLARLKNLKYFDYRLVDEESVKAAREKFIDVLIAIEQTEKENNARSEVEARQLHEEQTLKSLYLDGINRLFQVMYQQEPDLPKYLPLAEQAIKDLQDDVRTKYEIAITEFRHAAQKQAELRAAEISLFRRCVKEVKQEVDRECIRRIHDFERTKKRQLRALQQEQHDASESEDLIASLRQELSALYNYLLGQEMMLVEQFEDVVKEAEGNYAQQCQSVIELARQTFVKFREVANEYNEKAAEAVITAFDKFAKMDLEELEETIRELVTDKDGVVTMLGTAHEYRLAKVEHQEEVFSLGVNRELKSVVATMQREELERNRSRVIEIAEFMERTKLEIDTAEDSL